MKSTVIYLCIMLREKASYRFNNTQNSDILLKPRIFS